MSAKNETVSIKIEVDGEREAGAAFKRLGGSTDNMTNSFIKGGLAVEAIKGAITVATDVMKTAAKAAIDFGTDSVSEFRKYEKTMKSLELQMPRFGVEVKAAKDEAQRLGDELQIGVGVAAESLTNLLKGGLNLEQAADMMKRFANEAILGKKETISMAQAVENLSFAYNTQNSTIGNASGLAENFSNIMELGEEILINQGVAVGDITDDMRKYEGMIATTNLTLGAFDELSENNASRTEALRQEVIKLKQELGAALEEGITPLLNKMEEWGVMDIAREATKSLVTTITETLVPALMEAVTETENWWKENEDNLSPSLKEVEENSKGIVEETLRIAKAFLGSEEAGENYEELLFNVSDILADVTGLMKTLLKQMDDEIFQTFARDLSAIVKGATWFVETLVKALAIMDMIIPRTKIMAHILNFLFPGRKTFTDFLDDLEALEAQIEDVNIGLKEEAETAVVAGFKTSTAFEDAATNATNAAKGMKTDLHTTFGAIGGDANLTFDQMNQDFWESKNDIIANGWNMYGNLVSVNSSILANFKGTVKEAELEISRLTNMSVSPFLYGFNPERNASGTLSSPGGPTIVGEHGPELVNMPRGSEVFTATRTREMMQTNHNDNKKQVNIYGNISLADSGRGMAQSTDLMSQLLLGRI